ncbi:MAG: carboxypeptidase regulatory-like domain-containing protein [Acidobacteria bacterium]|nr:carboxypeptidase regulatory-like domain-containing protein [Acidobacteriota bacterium]MBS1866157.1 carboxypeptidase regulatory-like domain-containing protein [Acidobacteriota bacterium]
MHKAHKLVAFSLAAFVSVLLLGVVVAPSAHAQATLSTGSIQGIILDPKGESVPSAKVSITSKDTGQKLQPAVTASGEYSTGPVVPGNYSVRIEAAGFKSLVLNLVVQVGQVTTGNASLELGESSTVINVESSAVSVNTEQATVSGVLTAAQIDTLPINGRNFLDLAQLEPGVQIQEGSTFDPTKNGFSSISFQGRFGRTARIEVDGVDISDETVGTTTQNIPASAIQEFQLSQSSLDLSSELTSSGAVNVTTRSGTNDVHGQLFGLFRGNQVAAALPGTTPPPFQREQFGGRVGGRIIKDKLFWFADLERPKQDLLAAEPFSGPFAAQAFALGEPFREVQTDARADWNISGSSRAFYRFNFDQSSQIRPFGSASSLQGFKNVNHTQTHTVGWDFNTGSYTHSIRFSYLKFRNGIADGTASIAAGPDNPVPGLGINIGAPVAGNCVLSGGGSFCAGPNLLAPQQTLQANHQIKYDGSRIIGKHILRYGIAYNHIQGGGLAAFFTFPQVGTTAAGASADPTSYPIQFAFMGNGIGFSTAEKAFGFPAGGLGPDNRVEWYVGDAWKIRRNFTLTAGLHYDLDTGRVDSNLGPLPVLNSWGPGLGNQIRTPKNNFSPEVGLAWDVRGHGKTVIRAGGGLYYENSIWNNVLFDSPGRIAQGIFSDTPLVCAGGAPQPFTWPTAVSSGTVIAGGAGIAGANNLVSPTFCGNTIASGGSNVIALSNAFKAAAASSVGLQPNPNFIGKTLSAANASGFDVFDPNYRSPRSWQMNIGIQHEIRPGLVFTADYIRNIGEHYLIAIDRNHSGSARSFNQANAIAARDAAQTANGCPTGSGQSACMITALGQAGAQAAYSGAGLDSNIAVTGGGPCNFCAFPGTNPVSGNAGAVGVLDMLEPVGRSVYNGLQTKLVQRVNHPFKGLKSADFQISYSLSKFVSQVQDQDFINLATNNDNPLQFTGPNALDRKHQFSFGGSFELPWFTRLSFIGHFYSPLPQNILLPELTSGGEIFASDWLGSGLGSGAAGEPVPGTQIGQFGRGTSAASLQNLINNYNSTSAGTLTPAGKQLVSNGVLSQADMTALGWVMPTLPSTTAGAVNFPWLKSFDLSLAWPIPVLHEGKLKITPSVSAFNLFNFHNAFLPGNLASSTLGNPNSIGMVTSATSAPFLASFQSGTYALGAPRQFEFGLKIDF